jgi:hypothetical protein
MTSTSKIAYPREGLSAKPILGTAIALAGLAVLASPALANGAATENVDLMVDVEASCEMQPFPNQPIDIPAPEDVSSTTSVETTVDCNTPSDVTITSVSGGAVDTSGASTLDNSAYVNAFDYTATVSTSGRELVVLDTENDTEIGPATAFDATQAQPDAPIKLTVEPKPLPQGKILQAGSYGDQLTVMITPK